MYPQPRSRPRFRIVPRFGAVLLLLGAAAWSSLHAEEAEPLEVPQGEGPRPESQAELGPVERIERGIEAQYQRGFEQQPIQAWALLHQAARSGDSASVARALEVAPGAPSVYAEAARQGAWSDLPGLPRAFATSLPALIWLMTAGGVGLLLSVLGAAAVACLVGAARAFALHGHAFGHRLPLRQPSIWPGVAGLIGVCAALPLLGLGPALVLGALGALALARSPRPVGHAVAGLMALSGAVLGPGLDGIARLATQPSATPELGAAWRFDWSQPLPGDGHFLEVALKESDAADSFLVYSYANALKHGGDVQRARELLDEGVAPASSLLAARSASLRAVLRLSSGDVDAAIEEFERSRALGESATVLYNLSQAYARNVDLSQRQSLYDAARQLDPDLVGRYAVLEGANVHRYVIQEPLPLGLYLSRALESTPESEALAEQVRARLLGPGSPAWGWILLPALGVCGLLLRRESVGRCKRCDRPICRRCAKTAQGACVRCERLGLARSKVDARSRRQQVEEDRQLQRRSRLLRAGLSLVVPGLGAWIEGRILAGGTRMLLAMLGVGLVVAVTCVPAPFEVGQAAHLLALVALAMMLPLYLVELWGLRREASSKGRP